MNQLQQRWCWLSSVWLQGEGDPEQIEGLALQGSRLGEGGKFWDVPASPEAV